jgi:ATP-dependent protease ClpP protease subunit
MKQLFALFLLLAMPAAQALDFSSEGKTLTLAGKIEKGDYDKLVGHLRKLEGFPDYFSLASPGGDIVEATKIGTLFRDTAATVQISGPCYSACFFMLVGGVHRVVAENQPLGIHRPYFEREYFSGLSLSQAEAKYRELQSRSRNYLQAMGTPIALIEKMFSIPSDDVYVLKANEYAFLSQEQPAYSEWVRSQCKTLSPEERSIFNPFDMFDESVPARYASKEEFLRLKTKYMKAEECEAGLKQRAREKALGGQ